ncbi:hypothetical protein ACHAXA_011794 [Cyclostephanos tholiformis]|uniref:ADP,ATP carrier protein n=1 Tax=Cyclostephanos tholiformis TaxID=382380 RepID=A0ABD3R1J5_9STRA
MHEDDDNSNNDHNDDAPLLPSHWSSFKDKKRKKANAGGDLCGDGGSCGMMRILPPRILLLALYLMFTLSTFWILDSIKEPTLALLVYNNELGKHQPRAKMASFLVVVLLALVMEAIVRGGRGRRRRRHATRRRGEQDQPRSRLQHCSANAALEKSWEERNLPSSMRDEDDRFDGATNLASSSVCGGRWRKMGTQTSRNFWSRWNRLSDWTRSGDSEGGSGNYRNFDEVYHEYVDDNGDADDDGMGASTSPSTKLSTTAFYVVGVVYIKAFMAVAIALRHHPSFRSSSMVNRHVGHPDPSDEDSSSSSSSSWYYTALGYVFFALVESYGSVSITLFWSFANSHLTLEAAEKHYGSTVALAQAGAIGGSTLVAVLGRRKTNGPYGGPTVEITAHALVGVAAHEGVAVGEIAGAGNTVTPVLIFFACGCIAAGVAVMLLYARLFATPMTQTLPPPATTTLTTTAHYEVVEVTGFENDDNIQRGIGKVNNCGDRNSSRQSQSPIVLVQQPKLDCRVNEYNFGGGGTTTTDASHENNDIFADILGGVYMIYCHDYLQLILAVSVLYEVALTCMHYEMNLLGLDRFGVGSAGASGDIESSSTYGTNMEGSPDNRNGEGITYIQFMGWYGQTVNVLSLFLSFYAFPRLIKNYGLRTTILIFPTVLLLVTIFAFVLFPKPLLLVRVSEHMQGPYVFRA